MLESLPIIIIVSTALGFLAGIGVGGGSLLVLWLTLILGMDHSEARILNLLFFLPSAVIASIFRWKQGKLDMRRIFPAVICGCAAAAVGSILSLRIDLGLLKKLFGGILVLTGIREILYKSKKKERP